MRRILKLLAEFHNLTPLKWLPKEGTLKHTGAWFGVYCAPNESIAKFGKAADCKSVSVGSNPTTFFSVNMSCREHAICLWCTNLKSE